MRWFPLLLGLVAISIWAFATTKPRQQNPDSVMVGRSAPVFDLTAINRSEEHISLESLLATGKPVVLNFWASWCTACKDEAEDLQRFYEAHGDRVHLVGVAIQDREKDALRFARRFGMEYPLVIDPSGTTGIDYGMLGVPETFLIRSDGRVAKRIIGVVDYRQLVHETERILSGAGEGGA